MIGVSKALASLTQSFRKYITAEADAARAYATAILPLAEEFAWLNRA